MQNQRIGFLSPPLASLGSALCRLDVGGVQDGVQDNMLLAEFLSKSAQKLSGLTFGHQIALFIASVLTPI
jgi:hypothetical protein